MSPWSYCFSFFFFFLFQLHKIYVSAICPFFYWCLCQIFFISCTLVVSQKCQASQTSQQFHWPNRLWTWSFSCQWHRTKVVYIQKIYYKVNKKDNIGLPINRIIGAFDTGYLYLNFSTSAWERVDKFNMIFYMILCWQFHVEYLLEFLMILNCHNQIILYISFYTQICFGSLKIYISVDNSTFSYTCIQLSLHLFL